MRTFLSYALILVLCGCIVSKTALAQTNRLNGTWIALKQEMGGKALPQTFYEKQKLIIADSNYTVIAESVDKGIIQVAGNKMDIIGKEGVNTGKHFKAIYKFENDQLTICYNLAGDAYPESFETQGKKLYFLSVFKKE